MKQKDIDDCIELGVLRERQRIIKLLETEITNTPNTLFSEVLSGVIALIKGENK